MNIIDRLHERIKDFESILEAAKDHPCDRPLEWRGQRYSCYLDLANKYSGWGLACFDDNIYKAIRYELTGEDYLEYFLFFTWERRIDFILGDEQLILTEFPYCEEYRFLRTFYKDFIVQANVHWWRQYKGYC